jgi:hypothetical protein
MKEMGDRDRGMHKEPANLNPLYLYLCTLSLVIIDDVGQIREE